MRVPGQQVLVHDAPLYPTTESTFRMMGLQEVRADFNDADALEKVLAEHPQVQTTLVQLARQKIDDRYDFTQVVARLKEHGLTVITDDNYAVMKLPRIGCEAGSDVSCFSTFKLLGPEGIGVVTGKADLVDRIIAMHYSGGMQVQGHEALAVLRDRELKERTDKESAPEREPQAERPPEPRHAAANNQTTEIIEAGAR